MRPQHRLTSMGVASLVIALLLSLLGTPHSTALAASAPAQGKAHGGLLPQATLAPSSPPATSTPTPVQPTASVTLRANNVAVGAGVVASIRSAMTWGTYTLTIIDQSTGQEQDQSNPIFTPGRVAPFSTSSGGVAITFTAARPGAVILRLSVSGEYHEPLCNCLTWGVAKAESALLTAFEGATPTPTRIPTPTPTRIPTPTPTRIPTPTPTRTPAEPSASVTVAASSVQVGGTLVVSASSNLSLVGYTLTVIDQSTGQEQDQSTPIFTPARPDPIVGRPGVVSWTLTAARPGTVVFRVSAYGEHHGGSCGCYYFTTVVASSSPVSVTDAPTSTPTPTSTSTPTSTPTPLPTPASSEPSVLVTAAASRVQAGSALVVSVTSNLSLVGYSLTVIDQSTGQEQDQNNPIFTPVRPDPIRVSSGGGSWTLAAVRPGTVVFRVNAYGEFHGGSCGCYYFTTVIASSSPVSVADGLTLTSTPTPTPQPGVTRTGSPPHSKRCQYEAGAVTFTGAVALPPGYQQALLQTSWYITQPDSKRTAPLYQIQTAQEGTPVSFSVAWPGIEATDTAVHVQIGTVLLDPRTRNPIPGTARSFSEYWYPWVCPAPQAASQG